MYFFYLSFFFSILLFFYSFLEWDPLKSCVFMCLGIISMSCYISLGLHVWYSYFVVLIFLSSIYSLLTYFCSMASFSYFNNYFYLFFSLFVLYFFFLCFFDYDFFSHYLDLNFLVIYYDFNFYCIFWIVFVLFLFLSLASYGLSGCGCFMRGL